MSRWICIDNICIPSDENDWHELVAFADAVAEQEPIDLVTCAECKHRPVKEDADGENYGFNLIEPTEGDGRCPCLVSDGWYSWMPKDDFYCGYGERKEKQ